MLQIRIKVQLPYFQSQLYRQLGEEYKLIQVLRLRLVELLDFGTRNIFNKVKEGSLRWCVFGDVEKQRKLCIFVKHFRAMSPTVR